MTDLILGSEVSEFVVNRQTAKIQYLQQENGQLLEQVRDLERALLLNKDILKIAFESGKSNTTNNSSDATNTSNENLNKTLMQKLHEENVQLTKQVRKMTEERNLAQNKVLLQQQIAEESQAFYKDMIQDLDEKVGEMRRCIQDKEYAIQEIEKSRAIPDDGQMVKIREIVTPNEQTLRLHEELESTRQILNKISTESQALTDQNNMLKEINFNFKREIIKLRVVLRSQVAFYKMKEFIYEDYYGNTDDNLELQNEIYANPGYILSEYNPDHANNQQPPQDVLTQYGYQQPSNHQQIRFLSNNERAIYQDKISKSESLLKGFKELFEKEKNKGHLLGQKLGEVHRAYQMAEETNATLVRAHKMKEEKIKKLQGELQYYRKQYGNYLNLLKNKRDINLNLSFEKQKNRPTFEQTKQEFKAKLLAQTPQTKAPIEFKQKPIEPKDLVKPLLTQQDEDEERIEVNVSILENVDDEVPPTQLQEAAEDFQEEYNNDEDHHADEGSQDNDSVHPLEGMMKPKGRGLTIETEENEPVVPQQKTSTTTKNKVIGLKAKQHHQSQYCMSAAECKQFLLNSAKELYLTYNLRMNNLQRKQLMEQGNMWKPQQPIWHQKSSSDPLDYFTLNFQDLELKENVRRNLQQEDEFFQKEKKPKIVKQKSKNPFYLDVSLIQNKQDQKRHAKKVTINAELSFISNDNLLEGINQ